MVKMANFEEDGRPVVWCEYAHSMGNSTGNLFEFWDAIRANKRMFGGYIWDWVDQGLLQKTPEGEDYYAFGGDMGDTKINSGNFCLNGIVDPARNPKPALWECKKVFQPIKITAKNLKKGVVEIFNRHDFTNLNEFDITWELQKDGVTIKSGLLKPIDLEPNASKTLTIPFKFPKETTTGSEYFIRIGFQLKAAKNWANKGHEIAWQQLQLPLSTTKPIIDTTTLPNLSVDNNNNTTKTEIKGEGFTIAFSKDTGELISFKSKNEELIHGALIPNFWRPVTDNDRAGAKTTKLLKVWKNAHKNKDLVNFNVKELATNTIKITTSYLLKDVNSKLHLNYTIYGDGSIQVDNTFNIDESSNLPILPKYGMQIEIPKQYDNFTYLGKGPHENYNDRNLSADVGLYKESVSQDYHMYIRPQESSNKTEVRWFSLTNSNGKGFKISGVSSNLSVSAWPYTTKDIEDALHTYDLKKRDFITLNIDHKQMGVGGDDSWSTKALPHEPFRVQPKDYNYSFTFKPIK